MDKQSKYKKFYLLITAIFVAVFILSGCGKKEVIKQESQEIEVLKIQVENHQKQLEELKKQNEEYQKQLADQSSQIESDKSEADATQALIKHEAECRKLYLSLPECKSSNKIYWTKEEFDKFLEEEKKEHNASKSDTDRYEKKFKDCQAIIAKCG